MLIDNFSNTIDIWINELQHYDFKELRTKPHPENCSLGQVYMHLIRETNYYLEQIKIFISTKDNATEVASPEAKKMFHNNDFPDEVIEGSPANSRIPQPESKEQLMNCLRSLKNEINNIEMLISMSPFKGKTKHPGLNYFNAIEWLRFAEMHLRHHLRQKRRIDDFFKNYS